MENVAKTSITPKEYIKNDPYVGDNGIYVPIHEYTQKGTVSLYRCIITKELFVEAYNKWIKCE